MNANKVKKHNLISRCAGQQVYCGGVGKEKVQKKDGALETRCPRCPGGGSRKLQEQSTGFYLGCVRGGGVVHCFITRLHLSLIFFSF